MKRGSWWLTTLSTPTQRSSGPSSSAASAGTQATGSAVTGLVAPGPAHLPAGQGVEQARLAGTGATGQGAHERRAREAEPGPGRAKGLPGRPGVEPELLGRLGHPLQRLQAAPQVPVHRGTPLGSPNPSGD